MRESGKGMVVFTLLQLSWVLLYHRPNIGSHPSSAPVLSYHRAIWDEEVEEYGWYLLRQESSVPGSFPSDLFVSE